MAAAGLNEKLPEVKLIFPAINAADATVDYFAYFLRMKKVSQ